MALVGKCAVCTLRTSFQEGKASCLSPTESFMRRRLHPNSDEAQVDLCCGACPINPSTRWRYEPQAQAVVSLLPFLTYSASNTKGRKAPRGAILANFMVGVWAILCCESGPMLSLMCYSLALSAFTCRYRSCITIHVVVSYVPAIGPYLSAAGLSPHVATWTS